MPSWLFPTPISSSAQIMPHDSTPRSFDFLMTNSLSPSYSTQPRSATITFWPAATLGAPQTIWEGVSWPRSTVVTCKWSELGCGSQVSTLPTKRPLSPPLMLCTSSNAPTSRPEEVRAAQVSSGERLKSTYSFSHFREIFILSLFDSLKIRAKLHIFRQRSKKMHENRRFIKNWRIRSCHEIEGQVVLMSREDLKFLSSPRMCLWGKNASA